MIPIKFSLVCDQNLYLVRNDHDFGFLCNFQRNFSPILTSNNASVSQQGQPCVPDGRLYGLLRVLALARDVVEGEKEVVPVTQTRRKLDLNLLVEIWASVQKHHQVQFIIQTKSQEGNGEGGGRYPCPTFGGGG